MLSAEELQRLDTLFERACEMPTEQHADFLQRECGSQGALRDELERLLDGLVGEDRLGRIQQTEPTLAGTVIGPFHLLERIGKGGMGEVYLAEQRDPIVRRVALKIIRPGMDSAEIVARFHRERQALARMAHPGVAQVHGAGATEGGRPYFVMEYVDGEPITEYCDNRRLSTRQRLEILLDVCAAVQHAHQKGLIHRDLKPSNLLVTEHAGRPLPKVIDFGVARATTGSLAEQTLHTQLGQIVGTLEYMSPEQADPGAVDIDTRSDIYSLGVLLYELVSGLLPFERESMAGLPFSERLRTIREKDPSTPSTRLRRQSETATSIATRRGTGAHALIRQLEGDLDWICLKALEKDPGRRYASASELAADLRRHLAHQPVLAGRPGALYRARKFVRRNRVGVTAGLLVLGATLAGILGVISGRIDAESSARVARALRPLANVQVLRRLEREADALWPVRPDLVPALEAWQEEARTLLTLLPDYRAELVALRERALPWSTEEQARDLETHPDAEALASAKLESANLLDFLDALQDSEHPERLLRFNFWSDRPKGQELEQMRSNLKEDAELRLLELDLSARALEPRVAARRTWSFPSQEDAGWHAVLRELVEALEGLEDPETGLMSPEGASEAHGGSIPRRLALARRLAADQAPGGSLDEAWAAALPDLRAAYPDLDIGPQVGLLPLGPDPRSQLWEFAHLPSGPPAVRDADGQLVLGEDAGLVLVLLPGGWFDMGATEADDRVRGHPNKREEGPFPVEVAPFFLSKFEMTQAQWERATGVNPSLYQTGVVRPAPRNPVNQVDWPQCSRTTSRLGLLLPDEQQWEYAARGGTTTVWWAGDDPQAVRASANLAGVEDGFFGITTVGSFPANPFGLHDVIGNVHEWCANHPNLYDTSPGTAPETLTLYAFRGGSAAFPLVHSRSAARNNGLKGLRNAALGLRPARSLDPR